MKSVMVICIGNICRSPTAEALLARELPDKKVWSAGLGALIGNPADALAVEVAADNGLDLSAHRAQQLVSWMCQSADLILVMDQGQKARIEQLYPLVRGKVYRLGEESQADIADPYRRPREAFETAYSAISQGVQQWASRIRRLS